jgi:Platelet-activating factor acetylhydrolase, isoform II
MTPGPAAKLFVRCDIRRFLLLSSALLLVAGATGAPSAFAHQMHATTAAPALRPTLPPPSGDDRVGVVQLHLVDRSRPDPWVSSQPVRELMVSVWYPAQRVPGDPVAPWLLPAAWARFEQDTLGAPPDALLVPLTHGHVGAPVERYPGGRPVVLYSAGLGNNRDSGSVLVEELVSRGYIVVTIDHTHEASQVEFPGGRVEVSALPPPPYAPEVVAKAVTVRVADTRFVLDKLAALNAGHNPDAEHRRLPRGLRGAMDLSRIGMFGHSLGGATAAEVMYEDRRIRAGIDLDGTLFGPVITGGLNRPFLLVAAQDHGRDNDATWAQFWANLRGWRLNLRLAGSAHNSFTDLQVLVPQVAAVLKLPPGVVQQTIGTINPQRSIISQRAYVAAFFSLSLRHHDNHLLDHPSQHFPEMQFMP